MSSESQYRRGSSLLALLPSEAHSLTPPSPSNQATYSCVLLLDGNIVDLSEVVHSGRTSSASATCSFTLTSRWTVKFQDSRRADSIGSVHVNGEYLGAWSFKGTTDTGSGSPTVSGVVGGESQEEMGGGGADGSFS